MDPLELFVIIYFILGIFIVFGTIIIGNETIVRVASPHISVQVSTFMHYIVFFTMYFGFLLPKRLLKYHIAGLCLGLIHWATNGNRCILTQIHRKRINNPTYAFVQCTVLQNQFSEKTADILQYTALFASMGISIFRLARK